MGATLVAALVAGTQAWVANVGDSRAYVLRGDEFVQVTKDQSMLQSLIDAGVLTPEQIAKFPNRNVILQAVGQSQDLQVPVSRLELRRHDLLLLCSDGLWEELDDETIRTILATTPELGLARDRLIAAANEHGGHDNITVVLASVTGAAMTEATQSVHATLVEVPVE
jgi:serine/threonine protein phosphatase PrpC